MVDVYNASKKKKTKPKKSSKKKSKGRVSVAKIKKVIKPGGKEGFLTSFAIFPRKICFENQEKGEEVVLFLRPHPIINVGWLALAIAIAFIPAFFDFFPPYGSLPVNYQMMMVLSWYLLLLGFVFAKFMSWFFNIFIMTDERVVDVDFVNLFYRIISEAKIERVQDVHSEMSGVWQTFFNYGSVTIQTAGEMPQFAFENIPNPDLVARMINQLIDLEEQEKLEGRVK